MEVAGSIAFPADHIRITPNTLAELLSLSTADVARMIWRIRHNNGGLLYRGVRNKGLKYCIRLVDRYNIDQPELIPLKVENSWRYILRVIFMPLENRLADQSNELPERDPTKCNLLIRVINRKYPNWLEVLMNHPEYIGLNAQSLSTMDHESLQAMLRELNTMSELGVRFQAIGELDSPAC